MNTIQDMGMVLLLLIVTYLVVVKTTEMVKALARRDWEAVGVPAGWLVVIGLGLAFVGQLPLDWG